MTSLAEPGTASFDVHLVSGLIGKLSLVHGCLALAKMRAAAWHKTIFVKACTDIVPTDPNGRVQ